MVDVETGNNGLLDGEDGLLDAFHDFHRPHIRPMVAGDQAELEYHDWCVQEDAINNNHGEYQFENLWIPDDEVEARPQHYGEAADIRHPPELADDSGENWGCVILEFFENVAGGLQSNPDSRDYYRPKVQAVMALEGHPDKHNKLDTHPVGHSAKCCDQTESSWASLMSVTAAPVFESVS